jgi:Flp pilus assembly protein TadD
MNPTTDAPPSGMTVGAAYAKALELINAERFDEARDICMGIVAVRREQPDVYRLLGAIAYKKHDSAEATKHFRQALKLDPNHRETRLNLARVYRDFAQWTDAARTFEVLAREAPDPEVLLELGKIYTTLGRHADAEEAYRQALPLTTQPDVIETNLASALMKRGAHADADMHFGAVLARIPDFMPALINRAILRDEQGDLEGALAFLDKALATDSESVDAHFHHALALISRERLAEGWAEYVWRFKRKNITTLHDRFSAPYWDGEPLKGWHLLVWTEQGLGDEVLLAGMVPDVLRQGASCTLVCTARLAPLFQHSFPTVKILTREDMKRDASPAAGADYQASLSQLGLHLRPTVDAFPKGAPYLKTDVVRTAALRQKYRGSTNDRLIGIAWHSANPQAGVEKSIPLPLWQDVLRVPGFRFISLQYGDHSESLRAFKKSIGLELIVDKSVDSKNDLDGFAAQVAAMDLVISVSNTAVHFAGGLGVPVWTLLPAALGRIWYWFLERTDSPWYPSMKLFRRERGEGWEPVLLAVAQELRQWQ